MVRSLFGDTFMQWAAPKWNVAQGLECVELGAGQTCKTTDARPSAASQRPTPWSFPGGSLQLSLRTREADQEAARSLRIDSRQVLDICNRNASLDVEDFRDV